MQAVCPTVEGRHVETVTDELVRARLLELLRTDRQAPDFLERFWECHRLIGLAMEQQSRGETREGNA